MKYSRVCKAEKKKNIIEEKESVPKDLENGMVVLDLRQIIPVFLNVYVEESASFK